MGKLTKAQRDVASAVKIGVRAAGLLADAARLLSLAGHTQASRSLNTASHDAAQAIAQAEADAGRLALEEKPDAE